MGTHYSHLSETDRVAIQLLLQAEFSCRAIARQVGCSPSTICREVIRGKAAPTALVSSYRAAPAQLRSRARRLAAGRSRRKLGADLKTPLWRTVLDGLRCHWSPQQISLRLRGMKKPTTDAPLAAVPLSVSHETIYRSLFIQAVGY